MMVRGGRGKITAYDEAPTGNRRLHMRLRQSVDLIEIC